MMNKGLEIIEAKWIFKVDISKIQVLIHPQSIIHSLVEFTDGSVKAQLGIPDMKIPIHYALTYPDRLAADYERANLARIGSLTFEAPDPERFPALELARHALRVGGNAPVRRQESGRQRKTSLACEFYRRYDPPHHTIF